MMKYCREVAIELGYELPEDYSLPTMCCWSCHEDHEEGYDDLIWLDDDTLVCCGIARLIDDE